MRARVYPEWSTSDGDGRGDEEPPREMVWARYSACCLAGVSGGGGAMSAFLSRGSGTVVSDVEWCGWTSSL